MSGPTFSVICATLLRPSYGALFASVRRQRLRDFEFISRADPGNEYIARNRAAAQARGDYLVFVDDDAVLPEGYLAHIAETLRKKPDTVAISGVLEGNFSGRGRERIDQPGWWVGACMVVRRDVFMQRPFEETWGLTPVPRGWRSDTDLGFSIETRHPNQWVHDPQLVMEHPGPMGSSFQPAVEAVFFNRWRDLVLKRFIGVDHRLQQFLLETQDLSGKERAQVLRARSAMRRQIPNLPLLPGESQTGG